LSDQKPLEPSFGDASDVELERDQRVAHAARVVALIAADIRKVLRRYDADEDVLAIIGSWRDTLTDDESLTLLRDYNAGRPIIHRPQ
jgi:hypothetical protein